LAHQLGSWRGVNERAGIVGSDKVDASFTEPIRPVPPMTTIFMVSLLDDWRPSNANTK
jgi:hypothetical protein